MNAMDIKPRPKLIVSILKSMAHYGATSYTDSSVDPKDLFSFHLYVAEKDSQEYAQTDRRMATFLKVHIKLPRFLYIITFHLAFGPSAESRSICCLCASRRMHLSSCTTAHALCPRLSVKSAALSAKNATASYHLRYWR